MTPEKREQARNRLARIMRGWDTRTHRYNGMAMINYRLTKLRAKELGVKIGKIIRGARNWQYATVAQQNQLANTINTFSFARYTSGIPAMRSQIRESIVDKHPLFGGIVACDDCGALHRLSTSGHPVSDDDSNICENCLINYVWSNYMDGWVHENEAVNMYFTLDQLRRRDGDNMPREYVQTYSLRWSEYYSGYLARGLNPDDVEEDTSGPDGLNDYHDSTRLFTVHQQNPNALYNGMPPLGLELEVYADDWPEAVRHAKNFKGFGKLLFERDGSLSDKHGFEIITDPPGHSEWFQMGPAMCEHLQQECVAYNHPDSNDYGIHITLDRKYLSPLQEARMFLFMTASENLKFMQAIAQRVGIYAARTQLGGLLSTQQTVTYVGGLQTMVVDNKHVKKVVGAGKYAPINFKGDLAEIRIFQATLHTPSFMKNLEFVWAMVEWVRSSTGALWRHEDFVTWLGTRGNCRKDYPNLYDYLVRPSYRVKGSSYTIANTWVSKLPLPNPIKGVPHVPPQPANDQLVYAA